MANTRKQEVALADEALLASLGYKQEFKRAFTPLEVRILFCIIYSCVGINPHSRCLGLRSRLLDCYPPLHLCFCLLYLTVEGQQW